MKAMIFAAGKGTRLQPLTHSIPKALVPLNGTPLIEILIRKCLQAGISEIVVNVHHLSYQIIEFLTKKSNFGINIYISDESDRLLDTGGGLKKAAPYLQGNEPILIHNVDIVSDLDFNELLQRHRLGGAVATLAAMHRNSNRRFLVDSKHWLCGWENVATGARKITRAVDESLIPAPYCGIAIVESDFLSLIRQSGVFSLTDTFLDVSQSHPIRVEFFSSIRWADVGSAEKLSEAEKLFQQIP